MLLIMPFVLKKNKLHIFENIFLLLVLEFLVSTYYAILYVNIDVWKISFKTDLFIIFRVEEVILLPLLLTWYFNIVGQLHAKMYKMALLFFTIGLAYSLEYLLVRFKVITYKDWSSWHSVVILFFILIFTTYMHKGYRRILRREGIIK